MAKPLLRTASIYCLVLWAAIWTFYVLLRSSHLDVRSIPGAGPVLLLSLVVITLAPLGAAGLSVAAVVRQPRARSGWVMLALAMFAFVAQWGLFMASSWM
jgi:hypothetical protein